MNNYITKAKKQTLKIKKEFQKHSTIAIISAFGFLIALSWRDFILDGVNTIITYLGLEKKSYILKLISALIVTFISVLGILLISKIKVNEE